MSERTILDAWWDRETQVQRNKLVSTYPLPYDGAGWAVLVNFFGVVGLADARYQVTYVDPMPIIIKLFELWPKIKPNHARGT